MDIPQLSLGHNGYRVVGATTDGEYAGADAQPDLVSSSPFYSQRFSGLIGAHLLAVQERAVLAMLELPPGATVLEIGGGHAQLAGALAGAGFAVTVLGSCEAALRLARERLGEKTAFATGDLCESPFPDRSFDAVVSVRMMAHVADWRALVANMARLARRMAVVDFPISGGANALGGMLFNLKRRIEGPTTRRYSTMSRAEVAKAFAAHGLSADRAIGQFVAPMAAHRLLGSPAASKAIESVFDRLNLRDAWGSPVILRAVRVDSAPDSGAGTESAASPAAL